MPILIYLITVICLVLGGNVQAQSDLSSLMTGAKQEKEVVWYTTTSAGDNQAIVAGFTALACFFPAWGAGSAP